jgi:hypothetical protein
MPNKYIANCHSKKGFLGEGIESNDAPDLVGKMFWISQLNLIDM